MNYGAMYSPEYISEFDFLTEERESGAYYFTVQAAGDGSNYASSDVATSAVWNYTKPNAQLAQSKDLTWEWPLAKWTYPEHGAGYFVKFWYSPDLQTEPYEVGGVMSFQGEDWGGQQGNTEMSDYVIQQNGMGYYYFSVCALSLDVTRWNSSESQLSEPYYMDTKPVKGQLEDILNSGMSGDETLDAIQNLDDRVLKDAMLADDITADIQSLEAKFGGAAQVEVSREAAAFDASRITVVGANLNKSHAAAEDVKLVLDKPEKDHVIPAQYKNSVAVKFSMDLANVENTEELAVPVKITLPVPASINPEFLVILHYHADGTVDEIHPVIHNTPGGDLYATFVLTSFSDFTMTEYAVSGNPFSDVAEDAYYFAPVLWAVENDITTGMSQDIFDPNGTCTRAQIVTFLWRANGSPTPESAENPFTDVPAGQWYTDAVLWAVEKGITTGTSATTFSPDAGCTRGQVATFLWRSKGQPVCGGENTFQDNVSGAYYYDAVLWAVANGVTNGISDGIFGPDVTCTRGQIVTFLHRAKDIEAAEPESPAVEPPAQELPAVERLTLPELPSYHTYTDILSDGTIFQSGNFVIDEVTYNYWHPIGSNGRANLTINIYGNFDYIYKDGDTMEVECIITNGTDTYRNEIWIHNAYDDTSFSDSITFYDIEDGYYTLTLSSTSD